MKSKKKSAKILPLEAKLDLERKQLLPWQKSFQTPSQCLRR